MAAMIWDEQSQAFVETKNVPMRYDAESGAWVETTGMAWDEESRAWTERWNNGVSAYVYGAALETVTIKKNGIIVATVTTDSSGRSAEQIELSNGTYTLTGSVSGWTEEQTVDENTTKFRAMPEGALYWYGNECADVTGEWYLRMLTGYTNVASLTKSSNNMLLHVNSKAYHGSITTNMALDMTKYTRLLMEGNFAFGKNYWGDGATFAVRMTDNPVEGTPNGLPSDSLKVQPEELPSGITIVNEEIALGAMNENFNMFEFDISDFADNKYLYIVACCGVIDLTFTKIYITT